ncbi:MAG TPA: DinB family protein [Actinomycetota bacterium]|jgi:uncharacterized damage-inducible protein DinB
MASERDVLRATLDAQREHVLGILEGLSDEALQRAVLPTGWTCLGLVHHLAIDVERFWFRIIVANEPIELDESDNAWHVPPGMPSGEVFDLYRREIELANGVIEVTDLDTPPARWPDEWATWKLENLREVLMHVITETATHAGHLDAVRELIDGRTWLILT